MAVAVAVAGLTLVALPGLTRRWGRFLPPAEWARACAGSLFAGVIVLELGAILVALPTALRAAGAPALATACERTFGVLAPGGAIGGWAGAAVALTLPALAWFGILRARRRLDIVRIEPALGEHHVLDERAHRELVVLPTDRLVALSVDGDPEQVVVSAGLLGALSPAEVDAVIRHEAAHLDHGHEQFLLLATAVEHALAVFPPVRRSTGALRSSLERWADEDAVGAATASRDALRNALLGVTDMVAAPSAAAALSPLDAVGERLDALDRPQATASFRRRGLIYAPALAAAAVATTGLLRWGGDVGSVIAMAGTCTA